MDAILRELEAENGRLRTENEELRREVRDLLDRMETLTPVLEEARRLGLSQATPETEFFVAA